MEQKELGQDHIRQIYQGWRTDCKWSSNEFKPTGADQLPRKRLNSVSDRE